MNMTTITNTSASTIVPFEVLLPKMERQFKYFVRRVLRLRADNYDDALQDLRAIALGIYASLVRRGKEAFYTPIANYAIKRYKSGRYFTGSSTKDILADQTRILGRCKICSLSKFDLNDDNDLLFMVDPKANVADAVQLKLDFFEGWYRLQSPKDQKIIRLLAEGEIASAVLCDKFFGKVGDTGTGFDGGMDVAAEGGDDLEYGVGIILDRLIGENLSLCVHDADLDRGVW
jgi:hypothetical protein